MVLFKVTVMHLILNIIFSGVIVILAYKSAITFRFTLWLLSVMNNSINVNSEHSMHAYTL